MFSRGHGPTGDGRSPWARQSRSTSPSGKSGKPSNGEGQPGAAGVDRQSIADFEADLSNNLYSCGTGCRQGATFLRRCGGSIFRRQTAGCARWAFRRSRIASLRKSPVGTWSRILGAVFHVDSYGYRPGRSAIDAVRQARQRCWRYDWVLDIDVKAYFDSIDWERLLKAVRNHTDCRWVLLYIERWLKAPVQMEDGSVVPRTAGTPQGGFITP